MGVYLEFEIVSGFFVIRVLWEFLFIGVSLGSEFMRVCMDFEVMRLVWYYSRFGVWVYRS